MKSGGRFKMLFKFGSETIFQKILQTEDF